MTSWTGWFRFHCPASVISRASMKNRSTGRGNYTMGVTEQIIFPEINIDRIARISGMDITFVTTARTNEEAYELLRELGMPFKKHEEGRSVKYF